MWDSEFDTSGLLWFFRWVEEDPKEILQSVYECMERTCEKLTQLNIDISNIKGMHESDRVNTGYPQWLL